jgi:glycosyltransferase involved in cell wall biosynthesis
MKRWIVSMIGSREHYAPARALHSRGLLERFYTDLWFPHGRSLLLRGPGPARRLAGRFHPDLPSSKVTAFNLAGLLDLAAYEIHQRADKDRLRDFFIREAQRFARRVARDIRVRGLDREPGVFFGFKPASLETFQALQGSPMTLVLDQIDAAVEHNTILWAEDEKWPGWAPTPAVLSEELQKRWSEEWRLADAIFANSEWTKKALVKQGVEPEKITIGPLAYEARVGGSPRVAKLQSQPLRVLWVASLYLGKGIQYLIEAARGMDPAKFEFIVVGGIGITRKGLDLAPKNMRFTGLVPKNETVRHYQEADVYVLPTLSDGFAITQIEAMAHGLPVITTPNCGEVVTHGVDGLIVPAGDADALRAALERLERNRDEAAAMSRAALEKAKQFTLENYADKLIGGVEAVLRAKEKHDR